MRVLYLSHFGGLGGAERSLLELMIALRDRGVEPALLCPDGALSDSACARRIPVARWRTHTITRGTGGRDWRHSLRRMPDGWRDLHDAIDRFGPDILHANSAQAMLWKGPIGWRRGRAVVWHWRDFYELPMLARAMAHGAGTIVAISESVRTFASRQLRDASRRIALVRNGIADLPPGNGDTAAAVRAAFAIPADARLVVMAGQSVPRKGHAVLLDALARLVAQRDDTHGLLLCSEHDAAASIHTESLRTHARTLGCEARMRIARAIDPIAPVLRAADVVAVPSLREPFGRIAVEAMLARKPVVASAVDGLTEIVADGESGVLVPPGDAAALAAALARVLDDRETWSARGEVSRRRALELFSVSRVAAEMASLYAAL